MKNLLYLVLTVYIFGFIGCSAHPAAPKIDMSPPPYLNQNASTKSKKCYAHDGTLYGRGQKPIFSDKKAMHLNDIVTVVINESASQISVGNKKISGSSQNSLGGGVFSGGILKNLNGITDVGFKTNSTKNFVGTGSTKRNEKFNTTITARVVKVLDNGNYFIYGSRELLLNGVKQMVKVSGIIRSDDIDQYNTINSKYIADAKILYETEGDIRESMRKPWGSKAVESIWPF